MSKIRQQPDGPVWVRTFPVTFLHDHSAARHDRDWHKLTYAVRGHLEVATDDARWIVPADRAVWVPAGTHHVESMRAPVSMRSIYLARRAVPDASDREHSTVPSGNAARSGGAGPFDRCRTVSVSPLLRELILQITRLGALDRRVPTQARLTGVLIDLVAAAPEVPLELRAPRDPRARRFAELVTAEPGAGASIASLARRAGASVRTLERCFVVETGVAVGEWRRRVRLFHAMRMLEAGAAVGEVAHAVGYANVSAFSAAFSRVLGRSPTGRRRVRALST